MSQLISVNSPGNLHSSCVDMTRLGFADYVIHFEAVGGNTLVVLRVPDEEAPAVRASFGWTNTENPKPYAIGKGGKK